MAKLNILVAEDEQTTQALYAKAFSEEQFNCNIVENGELALLAYDEKKPDIILLDISMPIRNGFQVLQEIREKKQDAATTIIMVTSVTEKEEIVACAKQGIQGYIIKPFAANELAGKVTQIYEDAAAK